MGTRPSYWEIIAAYLHEGYRAWEAREDASGKVVEEGLGLSGHEGLMWYRELENMGLIQMEEAFNAIVAYRLAPHGLEVAERLPEIQRFIERQAALIEESSGPAVEKDRAKFSLKAELLKVAIQRGADIAIDQAPAVWHQLKTIFTWVKL